MVFYKWSDLSIAKNNLNSRLDDVMPIEGIIDHGSGRVFENEETDLKVNRIEEDSDGFSVDLSDGTKIKISPSELKTLFRFT